MAANQHVYGWILSGRLYGYQRHCRARHNIEGDNNEENRSIKTAVIDIQKRVQ